MKDPAPSVEILTFTLAGPVLAVRPFCNNKDYWQVYFDTNALIKDAFRRLGFAVPEQHYMVRTAAAGAAAAASFRVGTGAPRRSNAWRCREGQVFVLWKMMVTVWN